MKRVLKSKAKRSRPLKPKRRAGADHAVMVDPSDPLLAGLDKMRLTDPDFLKKVLKAFPPLK